MKTATRYARASALWIATVGLSVMACSSGEAEGAPLAPAPDAQTVDPGPVDSGIPDVANEVSEDSGTLFDAAEADVPSSVCNDDASPAEDPCVIRDDLGVFVAPSGSDDAAGTMAAPVKTLQRALGVADREGKRVYACAAVYDESILIASYGQADLFGGLRCPGDDAGPAWTYEQGAYATVAPSAITQRWPVIVSGLTKPLRVQDVEILAPNLVDPARSSLALGIKNSTDVQLTRVRVVAADGTNAEDESKAPAPSVEPYTEYGAPAGRSTNDGWPALGIVCVCPETQVTTSGGNGGRGESVSGGPTNGGNGRPAMSGGEGGVTHTSIPCPTESVGKGGAHGAHGAHGASAAEVGALTPNGWVPQNGQRGEHGGVGQGGGGGGGGRGDSGGGAGGCGGCPGVGGPGGHAGGSSIAITVFQSSVSLRDSVVVTGNAGRGGDGGFGSEARWGGAGGQGGCPGGHGGHGGDAGNGGGGAGGVSVGIMWKGTAPDIDDATQANINIGFGREGGFPASTLDRAVDGFRAEVWQSP